MKSDSGDAGSRVAMTPFQRECVELFVEAAKVLSLPPSLGAIYGLMFSSEEPLALDEIARLLAISRGSASMGLRWLRDLGAISRVYIPGERRDHFTAEVELRKLATGYFRERIERHLENGYGRIERLRSAVKEEPAGRGRDFRHVRMHRLERWYTFSRYAVPALRRLADAFQ